MTHACLKDRAPVARASKRPGKDASEIFASQLLARTGRLLQMLSVLLLPLRWLVPRARVARVGCALEAEMAALARFTLADAGIPCPDYSDRDLILWAHREKPLDAPPSPACGGRVGKGVNAVNRCVLFPMRNCLFSFAHAQ
jgi:hypothetical protein